MMAKYAAIAHAKAYDFNEESKIKFLNILKFIEFNGYLSVEFGGKKRPVFWRKTDS